jgi:hypothetical protein
VGDIPRISFRRLRSSFRIIAINRLVDLDIELLRKREYRVVRAISAAIYLFPSASFTSHSEFSESSARLNLEENYLLSDAQR